MWPRSWHLPGRAICIYPGTLAAGAERRITGSPPSGGDGPALGRREPRLPHGLELLPHPAEALLGLLRPLHRLALALLEGQHGGFGPLGPLGGSLGAQAKSRDL